MQNTVIKIKISRLEENIMDRNDIEEIILGLADIVQEISTI